MKKLYYIKRTLNNKFFNYFFLLLFIAIMYQSSKSEIIDSTIFFQEDFEDLDFRSRSWYDNTNMFLSNIEHIQGSNSSIEFHFKKGATTPNSGTAIRHKFNETNEIYISFWIKYSANWQGSNRAYHPHEFLIMTNKNSDWNGPAYTHLTVYIEHNEGVPLLAIQDAENIDESSIGVDLTDRTENRALAGCNGDSDGYGNGNCYSVGSVHRNGKQWKADKIYFQDIQGNYYKNDWHYIESYIKLNSISNGIGLADGIMRYWYDGELLINHNDIMMRTGINQDMKFNQFMIAPWIGDGSPIAQTMWMDNLTVANYRVNNNTGIKPSKEIKPKNQILHYNYPNPFNYKTNIAYTLTSDADVELIIFDVLGNNVITLVSEKQLAGLYEYQWIPFLLPYNLYFYSLKVDYKVFVKQMLYLQ